MCERKREGESNLFPMPVLADFEELQLLNLCIGI